MRPFDYFRPYSISEAIALRVKYGGRAVILNGGTDVVIQLREQLISPDCVIDIKHIEGLSELSFDPGAGLYIGACVTMNALGEHPLVRQNYPYLSQAALSVGSKQVRNRATCVGNIVNASPLCDTGTPLYALDAVLLIEGARGRREVPIRDFITHVKRTCLEADELVLGIRVPRYEGARGVFTKIARRREVDLSTVCGTVLRIGDEYRLAFGAVAPTPIRLHKTEALLRGRALNAELIEQAAVLAQSELSPIDDLRASRQYRQEVAAVIVRRSLAQLAEEV